MFGAERAEPLKAHDSSFLRRHGAATRHVGQPARRHRAPCAGLAPAKCRRTLASEIPMATAISLSSRSPYFFRYSRISFMINFQKCGEWIEVYTYTHCRSEQCDYPLPPTGNHKRHYGTELSVKRRKRYPSIQ